MERDPLCFSSWAAASQVFRADLAHSGLLQGSVARAFYSTSLALGCSAAERYHLDIYLYRPHLPHILRIRAARLSSALGGGRRSESRSYRRAFTGPAVALLGDAEVVPSRAGDA